MIRPDPKHTGQQYVGFDLQGVYSPCIYAHLPPETNLEELARQASAAVEAAITSTIPGASWKATGPPQVSVNWSHRVPTEAEYTAWENAEKEKREAERARRAAEPPKPPVLCAGCGEPLGWLAEARDDYLTDTSGREWHWDCAAAKLGEGTG